jgi:proline iminopeptidase
VFALRYPERLERLILITTSPSHEFWTAASEELERRATPEQKKVGPSLFEGTVTSEADFMEWWKVMLPLYFYAWDDKIGGQIIKRGVDDPLVAAYMFEKEIPHYDVPAGLPSVSVPTLVCSGRHDWVTPVSECEAIVELIPGAELAMFEKSGHMPFIEEQDKFSDIQALGTGTRSEPLGNQRPLGKHGTTQSTGSKSIRCSYSACCRPRAAC